MDMENPLRWPYFATCLGLLCIAFDHVAGQTYYINLYEVAPYVGEVEISDGLSWYILHTQGWNDRNAAVACRMVGYSGDAAEPWFGPMSASLVRPVWDFQFYCNGNETSLSDCQVNRLTSTIGRHSVGVRCPSNPVPPEYDNFLLRKMSDNRISKTNIITMSGVIDMRTTCFSDIEGEVVYDPKYDQIMYFKISSLWGCRFGGSKTTIYTFAPGISVGDLAFDTERRLLFYYSGGAISSLNLNVTSLNPTLILNTTYATELTLDTVGKRIFWFTLPNPYQIEWGLYNGIYGGVLSAVSNFGAALIASSGGEIFWKDSRSEGITRRGGADETIYRGISSCSRMYVLGEWLYCTTWSSVLRLHKSEKCGGFFGPLHSNGQDIQYNDNRNSDFGPTCQNLYINLFGIKPNEGTVAISNGVDWYVPCSDGWDDNDAAVACRMLGYSGDDASSTFNSNVSARVIGVWPYQFNCKGDEIKLSECNPSYSSSSDCKRVGLRCSGHKVVPDFFLKNNMAGLAMTNPYTMSGYIDMDNPCNDIIGSGSDVVYDSVSDQFIYFQSGSLWGCRWGDRKTEIRQNISALIYPATDAEDRLLFGYLDNDIVSLRLDNAFSELVIVVTGTIVGKKLVLDTTRNEIYWWGPSDNNLKRVSYHGDSEVHVLKTSNNFRQFAFNGEYLFSLDSNVQGITRIHRNTSRRDVLYKEYDIVNECSKLYADKEWIYCTRYKSIGVLRLQSAGKGANFHGPIAYSRTAFTEGVIFHHSPEPSAITTSTTPGTTPTTKGSTPPVIGDRPSVGLNGDCGEHSSRAICTVGHSSCVNIGRHWTCQCVRKYIQKDSLCIPIPTSILETHYLFIVQSDASIDTEVGQITLINVDGIDVHSTFELLPDSGGFGISGANPKSVTLTKTENTVFINPVRLTLIVSSILSDSTTITDYAAVTIYPNITSVETKHITVAEGTRRGSFVTEVPGVNKYIGAENLAYKLTGKYSDFFHVDNHGDIYCAKTISFEDMNQAEDIYAFVTELDIGMTITIDETKMVTKLSLLVVRDTFSHIIPEDTPENITVGRFGSDTPFNLFDFNLTDTSTQSVFFRYFNFSSLSGTIQKSSFFLDFTNTNAREFEFEIRIRWKSTMDFIRVPGKLTIKDVNNLAPKCVEPVSVFQVISGSPSRSYIGAVQASDVDTVGTVSYIIDDAEYSKVFDITRQTGVITAKQAITASLLGDRVSFTVGASDGFKTVECHVVVEILKLSNENANLNLIFNGTLQEETPAPALVANVFVRNYTNFKFMTTKDEENFALNSTTGEVTSKVKLDREKLPLVFRDNKVTFGIQANLDDEDSCTITIMGELTITVTDINDNPPCFVGDGNCTVTFQGSVMENVTGRQDVKLKDNRELKLFDPDETDNGGLTVTLDPNDGKLTTEVTNNVVNIFSDHIFDREETDHFSVTLRVSDTGGHTATASLVITIEDKNDNPPVFINQPYQYRISEDEAVGFHVGVVSASDRDTGQNAEILYSLYSSYFSVDERTGNITVKGTLNRESIPSFNDTLLAKDNGHPSLTATTSVFIQILDVNDNAPVFTQNEYRFITDENNDCNVSLGSVNATDQDIGNNSKIHFTISFSLRKFRVNKDGEIFCVGAGLDYEASPNLNFVVTATDGGIPSRSSSTHVVIQVNDKNDNAPLFKNNVTVVNVTDTDFNSPKLVALLEVTDKDSGDNKRFRFAICPEYNQSFTVRDTGALFTTYQKPSTWPRPECKVTVTDYGGEPLSSFAFIEFYVVDNSGGGGQSGVVFNSSNFTLKVQEVYNRTEDIGSLWIQNNRTSNVTFALISSVDGGINNNNLTTDCASFYLDPLSGKVTKNGILDRETKDLYTFLASVQENMDKDLTLVTINVEDVNEPPEFVTKLKQFDVDEDVLGDIISKADSAIAVDRDLGENGTMVFSLKKQEPLQDGQFNFKVNDTNGDISVVLGLDYETVKQYNITMEVGDKGHPPSDPITRTFNVLVNDVNDNAPTFVNTSSKNGKCLYDIKVYENETADSIVLGFSINDEDGKTFFKTSELTVNNQDDCPLKPVTYGFPTMSLLSDGTLDYETQQAYDCVITVTNVAPPRLSNNCSVHVSVLDVNDNVPQTHGPYRVNVTNGKINDVVLIINATDKDSLENSRLVYQFDKETNETSFFKIDQNDGRITIIKDLFQFTCPVASFVVRVSDNGSPVLSNTTTVTLNIISNNTQPWFQGPDGTCSDTQRPYPKYSLAIEEVFGPVDGMTADKELLAITACDKDDGKFETCNCSYDIVNGGENYFDINKSTGMIRQIRPVNREKTPYFLLTISAVDHGKPPRTSRNNAFLNITVNDLDDNPPRFDKNSFTFNVSNNLPVGETFGQVRAKDPDFGKNSSATYSVEFTQESPFIYNETTGYFEISESLTNMTDQTFFMALKATGITTPTPAFTAIAYVEITVYFEDPNKSTPKFNKSMFVNTFPFSARKGYHIGTYTAVDTDKGRFGDITYHLESNYWDTFIVDSKKGNISLLYDVINAIPYYIRTMNLTLWATDGGEPPKSGSCVIHYTLAGLENKECSARIGSTPAQQTSDPYEIPLYAAIAVAGCLLLVLVIGFLVMFSRNREAFNKYQMTQKRLSTLDNAYELKNESYQRLSKTRSSGEYNRTYDSRLEERDTYQRGYDQLDDYDRAYDPEPDYDTTGI